MRGATIRLVQESENQDPIDETANQSTPPAVGLGRTIARIVSQHDRLK
jgi:hypothetical protein